MQLINLFKPDVFQHSVSIPVDYLLASIYTYLNSNNMEKMLTSGYPIQPNVGHLIFDFSKIDGT